MDTIEALVPPDVPEVIQLYFLEASEGEGDHVGRRTAMSTLFSWSLTSPESIHIIAEIPGFVLDDIQLPDQGQGEFPAFPPPKMVYGLVIEPLLPPPSARGSAP